MGSVSMCVSPTASICVCVLQWCHLFGRQWSSRSDGVSFLNKGTGGLAQWDTRHGVSKAQREPYAPSATKRQKPPSLTTITEWQQPTQHNTHRQQKKRTRGGAKERQREKWRKQQPSLQKGIYAKSTDKRDNQLHAIRTWTEFRRNYRTPSICVKQSVWHVAMNITPHYRCMQEWSTD